ncbi:MAG: tyrosine-type recombinase/integrase [Anaerolineae bacterium]|nr:tyrosine-type recombinase/integrase [Anaerolineae bacterium]
MSEYRPTTVQEATERFLTGLPGGHTADTYRWGLAALARCLVEASGIEIGDDDELPPYPTGDLDNAALEEFYHWCTGQGYSRSTIRTYLSAARRFLTWLDAHDLLPPTCQLGKAQSRLQAALGERARMPYQHRRIDPEVPRIVTYYDELPLPAGDGWAKEQQRLILLRARAVVHTLYSSGGRASEVAGLTRELVLDGRLDEVHIAGKGGEPRVILLTREAMRAIRAYLKERGADGHPGLFVSHGRGAGEPITRTTIWRIVKEAARALDLHETTSPHSFRHFRATQLLNQGMPLELVQAYLGHRDIATTRKVYAHTHTAVLREQLQEFGRTPTEALADLDARLG